jgi:hypothetical protein
VGSFSQIHSRPGQPEIDPELRDVAHVVHAEFDDRLDPGVVDECLDQVTARFNGATVRSFIPLLVSRYVREELQSRLRHTVQESFGPVDPVSG